ncbi:sarcosine oxidase subunit gamma [Paracoccus sp. MBLB3053]|uniref:Sarcosine oxidase subunit gamma n=1 Tax=Paracoccus aurantius TaxID=3073814 RepID=A0ABU2HWW9_9RHOB|nr:sarcosine oxidase subunit gamma [Paracoccus sp. MBLB3053]MDS9469542.1 sarcosine oxidase subunit gamma [Paracoccus sp. MBLB3053]
MTDLAPICALGSAKAAMHRIGSLSIREDATLGLASLALRQDASPPQLGLELPGPGGWTESEGVAAFWTGPEQWMIEYPGRAAEDVASLLAARAPGCSVTEQTDGFVAFEIEGPARSLVALTEKLVNIDPRRFAPGAATRTGFHHMSVYVIRRAETRMAILGMRSAAGSLWHGLTEAAERLEEVA